MSHQKITQHEMVKRIANKNGLSQALVTEVLQSYGREAMECLHDGYTVSIPVLGTLSPRTMQQRTGRNLKTNEPVSIPVRKSVKFALSKTLKENINNESDNL